MGISNNALLVPRKNTAAVAVATFSKIGTADFEVTTCGAGEQVTGIFYDTQSTAGRDVSVAVAGITRLTLGGTVTRGAKLKSDASGYGVTSSTDTEEYGAVALQSGVSGDIIEVLVTPAQTLSA
jgi:hypothetical protein